MALLKPLVFDAGRGISRQLQSGDALQVDQPLQIDGAVGFYGATPTAQQPVAGEWGQTLDQLIKALALLGLLKDSRPATWLNSVSSVSSIGQIGPYEPGRLVIGSPGGWRALDQPVPLPGVIQVPVARSGAQSPGPGGAPAGLSTAQLAYAPVLSYGTNPPAVGAPVGALWFDSGAKLLKVYTGTGWSLALPQQMQDLSAALSGATAGAVLSADGRGGIRLVPAAGGGLVLGFADGGVPTPFNLVTVAPAPPWANGDSAHGVAPSGGGRPSGLAQAIWCNTSVNAETIGFWNETAKRWDSVYVNNPVLNQLAELRSTLVNGDLFTVRGNAVVRLPIGAAGETLTATSNGAAWRGRFKATGLEPSNPLDGDIWLDSSTDVVRIRDGGRWLDINAVGRYVDTNGTGGGSRPGQLLIHAAPNWQLAPLTVSSGAVLAIALEAVPAGGRLAAAISGVVSLSEAQWDKVIDSSVVRATGTGLTPGRDYYASSTDAGFLTTNPAGGSGVPVGTALSGTHLLLRPGGLAAARQNARVQVAATAPASARDGELWWSPTSGALSVWNGGSWSAIQAPAAPPAAGGAAPGGGAAPVSVVGLVAADISSDPAAAAIGIRFSDGHVETLRIRGASGTQVTMADAATLVIDASGAIPAGGSGGGGLPGTGTTPATGAVMPGNGVYVDTATSVITRIDEGVF